MGHANSVWPRNKTLGIAMSSQAGTAQTPATINETPRNVTGASWPFPPPRIGACDAPAIYNAASSQRDKGGQIQTEGGRGVATK